MNHSQLRAFHAVASNGSFTKAAAVLNVTQPTLSGQVKALEEGYGIKLFERRGRGIEITGLGRALHDVTSRLFTTEAEARQLLTQARGLIGGRLRVGADSPYHVLSVMAAFGRRYPAIERGISFGNSEEVLDALLESQSDVAFVAETARDPRLHAVPVKRDRLVAFVERGHDWSRRRSIKLGDLSGRPVFLREPGSTTRAVFDRAIAQSGIELGEVLVIGSREGVREAVAAGLGVGLVSESEFGHDERLHPLPVRDAKLQVVEYAVCLDQRRDRPVVKAFFELVQELMPV
jgi:aminoethylphosphonate catabolism LysR family transcriptional regulator